MSDFTSSNSSSSNIISGIDCHVTGCKYHHPGGQCSATNVKVEAPDAHSARETYCGSFSPTDGCSDCKPSCAPDCAPDCGATQRMGDGMPNTFKSGASNAVFPGYGGCAGDVNPASFD